MAEGGCAVPVEVQVWPAESRNREMYLTGPEEHRLASEDTTVEGVPATWYYGHLEVYYPDVTVVVFAARDRADLFARALVKAPSVLTDLASYGLRFRPGCVDDRHYCEAEPSE